ncbi:flagellar biosynthetic protein FliO [Marinomonas transparens]|uniref:Flagellar protein n=1 Tax=Marinomonas transparens TaxID=2795388 RepID=A0A934JT34_9GAMM|nr:flagellar biosynthetic protein FliO [Marinomonas transparens]MBJ7536794.1 flagellar biosynthetic protein FliO [Marinomonas transparens]
MAVSSLHASDIQNISPASSVWKVVASLVFIIALIPACLWLMKRFQLAQMKLGRQSDIKVISIQTLGAKEKLMLIEVEGERVLIGVTGQSINHIKSFSPGGKSFAKIMSETEVGDDANNGGDVA